MTDHFRQALEEIASASPTLLCCAHGERRCSMCHAMIDLARERLGWAPWPAPARTLIQPTTSPT